MNLDLAVVIPTLNEEDYIGRLLDSIITQTVLPKEIVIVDAFSKDRTISEIKKRQKKLPQLKYYQIEKYSISRQRNFGVKKTKASHILFLDSDMVLKDPQTLEKYWKEIKLKKPDIAAAKNLPDSKYWKDFLFFWGMDITFKSLKNIWPMANTMNLYVSRKMFNKVKGFDEDIKVGEDHEFLQRVMRNDGNFIFLKKPLIYTSTRRLQTEGRRNFIRKMFRNLILVIFKGYKHIPNDYKFGHFKK